MIQITCLMFIDRDHSTKGLSGGGGDIDKLQKLSKRL